MVFLWFSYGFPPEKTPTHGAVSLENRGYVSHNQMVNLHFPMVFLWFSYGFPIKTSIFLWFEKSVWRVTIHRTCRQDIPATSKAHFPATASSRPAPGLAESKKGNLRVTSRDLMVI